MIRWLHVSAVLTSLALFALIALPGCNTGAGGKKDNAAKGKAKEKEHDHDKPGPHGGPVVEWGSDEYHAEFTVDHPTKMVTVYVLDGEMTKAPDVEALRFSKVKLTVTSEKPSIEIDLKHDAKKSGKDGIAFTGSDEFFAKPAKFEGKISSVLDEKSDTKAKPYSNKFEYEPKKEGGDKKKNVSTRELYLKPGGIYTAADIKVNGDLPAMEKYKGKKFSHDDAAKPGDKICPISEQKASPECTWVVGGQRYEFCCPPCVNTFLKWAHNEPEKVKRAEEYVFKGS